MLRKQFGDLNSDSTKVIPRVQLPPTVRSIIRDVRHVGRNGATTTRELALHVLTSSQLNIECLRHKWSRGTQGAIGPRIMGTRSHPAILTGNLANCGCSQEDVLWDFLFWKTAEGPRDGRRDPAFEDHSLPATLRPYIKMYDERHGLKLDDHYTWDINAKGMDGVCTEITEYNSPSHQLVMMQRTIVSLNAKVKQFQENIAKGMEIVAELAGVDPLVFADCLPK